MTDPILPDAPQADADHHPLTPRLRLPGPRPLWWLASVGLVVVSLSLSLTARDADDRQHGSLRFSVRLSALSWRLAHWAGVDQRPAPPRRAADGDKAAPAKPTAAQATLLADARTAEIDELFRIAQQAEVGAERPVLSEEVVAHCIATEQDAQALRLVRRIKVIGADLRTALVALPGEHTASVAALGFAPPSVPVAVQVAAQGGFGRSWSEWTRDRIRLRLGARPGAPAGGSRNAEFIAAERNVTATAMTLLYVVMLFGLWGIAAWLTALLRSSMAASRGMPRWEWLRARYPGLPTDNPYALDPLTPWLGLALWIGVQLAIAPLLSMPGLRTGSPFGVLMEAMVGLAAAQWAVTWLSPTRVPLIHAARLGGDPTIPLGQASTASLRALAALLPTMAVTTILSSLLIPEGEAVHPVATMLLDRPDAVNFAVIGAAAVLVGPVGEELLFRGLIYRQLRQRSGVWVALLVSSLLFAVMHASPGQLPAYVVLGAAFALVYEWVGSLWAAVILHALWNLGTFVILVCTALS